MAKYKRLEIREREVIMTSLSQGQSMRSIASLLKRNVSTISREIRRYTDLENHYGAHQAHTEAFEFRKLHREKLKISDNQKLLTFIHDKLRLRWSPDQIARRLKKLYPNDQSMHVSHETIYTYLYVMPKGELKKELLSLLRQKKKQRTPRKKEAEKRGTIPNMVSIHERPAEVESRVVPGHWEGDLILGKDNRSAIGTLVERTTRTLILVKLKAKDAESVRKAFQKELATLPEQMRISMTYDLGKEMAQHELFAKGSGMKVYFCDPHAPWQRGTNENTNGLIRDFFEKGTDLSVYSKAQIKHVQHLLNERPRKTLDYDTPKERFNDLFVALGT